MIEASGLRVAYRDFALGPISFRIEPGEFVSLIDPNGSGKSTLIRAVVGLSRHVKEGSVSLRGESAAARIPATFARVGYVSDSAGDLLSEFTAREYWNYCRIAHERASKESVDDWDQRAEALAASLDLVVVKQPISSLSLGTARKVQIVAALLPRPEVLILDEPFIGLDFLAARTFESLLATVRNQGTTVLASSHDLDLTARVADRLLVLHKGALVLDERVAHLDQNLEDTVQGVLAEARAR